jgi:hypothetical protein
MFETTTSVGALGEPGAVSATRVLLNAPTPSVFTAWHGGEDVVETLMNSASNDFDTLPNILTHTYIHTHCSHGI